MKYEIDFPDLGCYCVRTRSDEYRFCIYDYTRREIIKIPPNVNGVPVTEVLFERDGSWNMTVKKVYITKSVRKIERERNCYSDSIPEIIIDDENPFFHSFGGGLYQGDRLLFVSNICKGTFRVSPETKEICDNAFKRSNVDRVILPPSISKVGDDALSGCGQTEVFDNFSAEIIYSNNYSSEFIVHSYESGEMLYKLFIPGWRYWDYHITKNRNFGNLDLVFYDNSFEKTKSDISFDESLWVCLDRLMYPYRLSKAAEARYKKFICDNNTHAVKTVIDADKQDRLCFLSELGVVVPENLEELTEYCVQREKTEFTALLLAYKGRNFPDLPPVFSLE